MALVEIRDVHKVFQRDTQRIDVFTGITLDIAERSFLALMGPSGSGKSTLLNLLAGLDRPSAGTITVAGVEITRLDQDALARFRRDTLGYVFQSYHLIPTLTAAENVAVPLEIVGANDALARARALLHDVGLADRAHHYPVQLSGGEQQRVALARAVALDPGLLLADEPTGNLDSATGTEIMGLFQELHDSGQTIVLVTHEHDIAAHARRQIHLLDGKIARDERMVGR